jgi:hypothetical protein
MKTKTQLALTTTTTILSTALLLPELQAAGFEGSIGFDALGIAITGGSLATSTGFTLVDPSITTETGVYSGVSTQTAVTFGGFELLPPAASVTPLWTFDAGGDVYSFDATSISNRFNAALDQLDISGNGMAMVTGYTPTPGTWEIKLSAEAGVGATIEFNSSTSAPHQDSAPDGGSTAILLGGGFVGLAGISRKLRG